MNGTMLLHPTWHSKDVSGNKLQTMLNEMCKERFHCPLKIDKFMINHQDPDNFRRIAMSSSLKQHEGIENSANHHVNKAGIQMVTKDTDMSKIANAIIANETMTPTRITITKKRLAGLKHATTFTLRN